MWFFQHKNLLKPYCSWLIIGMTIFGHIVTLLGLFFVYHTAHEYFTIAVNQNVLADLDITLLSSLVKKNPKKISLSPISSNTQKPSASSSISTDKKSFSEKKQMSQKKSQKKIESQPATVKSKIVSVPSIPPINQAKKPQEKKQPLKKESAKKNSTSAQEKIISKNEKKIDTTKIEPLKCKKEEISDNKALKKSTIINTIPTQLEATTNITDAQEALSSLSLQELEFLKKVDYLQKELARVWRPPVIHKANPTCTAELFINWQGIIESIKIVESSGVLLFDSAARKALYNIKIPEWAKGKSITIVLKA